jgi:hypothetical protein
MLAAFGKQSHLQVMKIQQELVQEPLPPLKRYAPPRARTA